MELSKQVVSLELSKKLKELGVKQESAFNWCNKVFKRVSEGEITIDYYLIYGQDGWVSDVLISAFTAAELGNLLPARIDIQNDLTKWEISLREELGNPMTDPAWLGLMKTDKPEKREHLWNCNYGEDGESYIEESADTLADAMAKMLIYLIENNLFTPNK
jgi:hypothetical protein